MRFLASAFAAVLVAVVGFTSPALAAPIAPKLAAAQSADDVAAAVKDLYQRYFAALSATMATPDSEMPPEFDWKTLADGYFTPDLAARFKKALSSIDPVIDWDFLADGQDFGELKVVSAKGTQSGNEATVAMKTSNFGNETTSNVMLTRTAEGWRIKDFQFWAGTDNAMTLTSILKDAGY